MTAAQRGAGNTKISMKTNLAANVVNLFFNVDWLNLALTLLGWLLLGLVIFRTLSRNTYKRYRENRWFLMQFTRLKDRTHRYFTCPKCRQSVRVPRGKGKIMITCPKCKEKFPGKS